MSAQQQHQAWTEDRRLLLALLAAFQRAERRGKLAEPTKDLQPRERLRVFFHWAAAMSEPDLVRVRDDPTLRMEHVDRYRFAINEKTVDAWTSPFSGMNIADRSG